MKLTQAFKMGLRSILGNKIRSFLTMLGIIIGVAAVMTLVSLVQGYQTSMMEWIQKQGTNKISVDAYIWSGQDITDDLYDFCLKLDDLVVGVTPNSQLGAPISYRSKKTEYTSIYLGNDQFSLCNNYQIERGRDISFLDVKKYNKICVIGSAIADSLFGYSDPIGKKLSVYGIELTVVGQYTSKFDNQQWSGDDMIAAPYSISRFMGQYVYNSGFTVKAKDERSTKEAIARLESFLSTKINDSNGYYYVYSTNQSMESSNEMTNMLSLVLGGIAGIALLVGGIGIMNIMLVTVTERTREIGIRKAIGARRGAIISQFLVESSVLSVIGGLIGIAIGFLLTLVLGKVIFDLTLFPSVAIAAGAVAFSVAIGVGFGIYPAIKASGLQPVDALRME